MMMRIAALVALLGAGLASAATTTSIKPGAVTASIAPHQSPPPGCSENYSGSFEIGHVNVSSSSSKRMLAKRDTNLGITMANGILTDPLGRTGYIASNQQFQFDGPPQAGAIWTAGFSVCPNGSLALGSDVIWWACLSGSFSNLYFESIGGQCVKSYIIAYGVDGGHPIPVSVTPTPSASGAAPSGVASSSAASNATVSSSSMVVANSSSSAPGSSTMKTTTTKMPPVKHTTQHGGGSGVSSAAAASSSTTTGSGNAAPTNGVLGTMLGVAGGLYAFSALV